jgi:hypothetical protein
MSTFSSAVSTFFVDTSLVKYLRSMTGNLIRYIKSPKAFRNCSLAYNFRLEDLQKDALQFIFPNGKSCLESTSFLSLSSGCVQLIIESDKLNCTEEIIYQKMIEWAEQQCRKEQHVTTNIY